MPRLKSTIATLIVLLVAFGCLSGLPRLNVRPSPLPVQARYCSTDAGLFVPCVYSRDEWSI